MREVGLSDLFQLDYYTIAGDRVYSTDVITTIPNCKLWLASDKITGKNDGDSIALWPDASGNGNDATQSTEINRPIYKTSIKNGKPVVRFDGSNDFMLAPSLGLGSASLFVVAKQDLVKTSGAHALISTRPNTTYMELYLGSSASPEVGQVVAQISTGSFVGNRNGSPSTSWSLVEAIFKGDSTPSIRAGINGSLSEGIDFGSLPSSYSINGTSNFTIGQLGGIIAGYYFDGDIAEIVVYSRALSDSERQDVEAYLTAKYALY